MKNSVSIIIPAYNEAENLSKAVNAASRIARRVFRKYEILVINDGSVDETGAIADRLAKKYAYLRVYHHQKNKGVGAAIRNGIRMASGTYITGFPADMDWSMETFTHLLQACRNDAIVSYYLTNMSDREPMRQIFSIAFTTIMNTVFGLHLRYYNGHFIVPTRLVQPMRLLSNGFTIFSEIKIRLIRKNIVYTELQSQYKPRSFGFSKAFTTKTIVRTLVFLPMLIVDIYRNE